MIIGKHLIAGEWLGSEHTFRSEPHQGMGREYAQGRVSDINAAVEHAKEAFRTYSQQDVVARAALLNLIATELERSQSEIITVCCEETGLAGNRVDGEFTRTVNQVRYFAEHISREKHLNIISDDALPDRTPLPRPALRMVQRPIGPVAVFGASNFPLAFSTAGGDVIAALAAGCPVVVKGHSAHPGTADCVAQCIDRAIKQTAIHAGVFSQVQSDSFDAGQALVSHPQIKAVGFTGSTSGGRFLYNLCAARPEPIPFFGELGSINPVFILPEALQKNTLPLAKDWLASLSVGAGQLCTNPGVLLMTASAAAEQFVVQVKDELRAMPEQVMLSDGIAQAFRHGHDRIRDSVESVVVAQSQCQRRRVTPGVYRVSAQAWMQNDFLAEEVFGPLGIIVVADSTMELLSIADSLHGQLTCTVHMEASDKVLAQQLLDIVEHKAGRIIANGFPTGVEVCDAMVHGGPYPASTNFGASSVGSIAIQRFLRPVCYQNMPVGFLS